MAMRQMLEKAHRTPSQARAPRFAAIAAIASLLLIGLYSSYAIHRLIASNAPPTVTFTLGTAHRDVTYCNSQTLDIYIPEAAAVRPLPLAIFVHGGGMTAGDKANINPVFLDALASAGYAVASVNYRMAPHYKFPAQLEDVKCAIRYLRSRAQTYGVSARGIVAFGTSVGGQLVALAALTGPGSVFDVGPYRTVSSGVTAVADLFGPANITEAASGYSPSGIQQVFGSRSTKSDLLLASPTHYVVANAPAILLIQGASDTKVLKSQSIELHDDLVAAGDQTRLVLVQNMGHMFTQVGSRPIDPGLPQIAAEMVSWFERYGPET